MGFSLSPSVEVREYDLSVTASQAQSSRTGVVLRADKGPAMSITSLTSEADLVNAFGKPNSANYQDWFQAWNFLQYASSLYAVRPLPKITINNALVPVKNAMAYATGSSANFNDAISNCYNSNIAELTLADDAQFNSNRLWFINKYIAKTQDNAVAVCSSSSNWAKPIATEFMATVDFVGTTDIPQIDQINGKNVRLSVLKDPNMVPGSQFISNSETVYTVQSLVHDAVPGSPFGLVLDKEITKDEVSKYYGTVTAVTGANTLQLSISNYKIAPHAIFTIGVKESGVPVQKAVEVSSVVTDIAAGVVNVTFSLLATDVIDTALTGLIVSNTDKFTGVLSESYLSGLNYVVPVGTKTVKLQPGFTYEIGSMFTLGASGADTYMVTAIDTSANTVTLNIPTTVAYTLASSTVSSITVSNPVLKGINFYSSVFDESMVITKKVNAKDLVNGVLDAVTVTVESLLTFKQLFDYEPNWSAGEFVIISMIKDSTTGLYTIASTDTVSYTTGGKNTSGRNIFVEQYFYDQSAYLYIKVGDSTLENVETTNTPIIKILGNVDCTYTEYTKTDVQDAAYLFADSENFDVNILIAHELDINGVSEIAETRKDCVAIVAPYNYTELINKTASSATAIMLARFGAQTNSLDKIFTRFGTYSAVYGNMKYQYDKFNDQNRWVCLAGDVAGLCAQTDNTRDPWWAPAGLERGKIKNVIKLAFNPNKQNRDELYTNSINPIMSIAGEGAGIVFGQKTATAKPSAFDRLNVRRLLIVIEKTISTASRYSLFEFNDSFTRNRLVGLIEPFLRSVKGRRGLYDFMVVCDDTNNTSEVIDNNGLVIDVYLKPTKVAEFIKVNAVVVKTGANFLEVVGQFGG